MMIKSIIEHADIKLISIKLISLKASLSQNT